MSEYIRIKVPPKLEGKRREPKAHVLLTWTRVPGRAVTLCKRTLDGPETSDHLPATWRVCGSCERIAAARDVES